MEECLLQLVYCIGIEEAMVALLGGEGNNFHHLHMGMSATFRRCCAVPLSTAMPAVGLDYRRRPNTPAIVTHAFKKVKG
jgi:hypothetical protein